VAARLRRAWADLPQWARWVLAVYLVGFAQGAAAHIRDLTRGGMHEDPARLLHPVGLLPITLFGVFVLATTLPLLRVVKD
jgi:hypothetical protein